MADHPSAISGAFRLPFAEQVAYFQGKIGNLVPTARWDEVWQAAHDAAFMAAGAAKADLLADLAAAVERAINEGVGLETFRKDFMATVERRGWMGFTGDESPARRAWRTRLIYQTNAATSYAAGRYAQLQEGGFPFWVYRHNDAVTYPRPEHVSWNGLTLPQDHPFWRSHYPPNGWGCRCYVNGARSAEGAKRLGGDPGKEPPEGWDAIDATTGAPVGIGKGWGYAPGATVASMVRQVAGKLRQWPDPVGTAFTASLPAPLRERIRGDDRN